MISVDPLIQAALESDNFNVANLVSLPGGLYFTDWSADIAYGGNTYVSNGHLLALAGIKRESGLKTHDHTIKLSGVDLSLLTVFASQNRVGEASSISRVILDDAGAIIAGEAITLFMGTLDSWASSESAKTANITLKITSDWAANRQTTGRRTTQHSQQEVLSSDRFFEHAHIETSNIDWGN